MTTETETTFELQTRYGIPDWKTRATFDDEAPARDAYVELVAQNDLAFMDVRLVRIETAVLEERSRS